jgi:hypothetical protein
MKFASTLLASAALLVSPAVALAHQGNPHYRSVVKTVSPSIPGVQVSVLNFDDRLLLHNTSGKDILILDYQNKPYAQVNADGTVKINTASEAYYLNEDRLGQTTVPPNLPKTPQWKELSRSGRFEWHDHRMHWMGTGDPPNLKDKSKATLIDDWKVPVEIGGTKGNIAGTLTWVPLNEGSLPLTAIFTFAGLVIVLCLVLFYVRRRRASGGDGGAPDSPAQEKEVVEAW